MLACHNQEKVERLKILRKNVNWEIKDERLEFLEQFILLTSDWDYQPVNLRDIFQSKEIECLLSDCIDYNGIFEYYRATNFMYFIVFNGFKDEPQVGVDGNPLLHHTTPLHRVARHHNFPQDDQIACSLFQIYNRTDVNYTDQSGLTHFHVACGFGCYNVVKQFLDFGQDPNLIWPETGDSPLHLALDDLRTEVAELLLKRGANPTWANLEGLTPLHLICKRITHGGFAEIFFQISDDIQETLQVDVQDKYGNAPLHLAVEYHNCKAIEFQLKRGANPNLVNEEGSTPLHLIRDSRLAKLFFDVNEELNQSVQVDARDKLGRTPLQLAVINLLPDVIDVLLDHGADLSNFVFPPENCFHENFGASLKWWCGFLLERVTGALAVVERLENRGYELDRSDALAIMKFFAKLRLFEKSVDIVKYLNDVEFKRQAKEIDILPHFDLYESIQLQPKMAAKLIIHTNYYSLWRARDRHMIQEEHLEACVLHLCENVSRGFFRRWALKYFFELLCYRIPILCCEIIVKQLTNKDLFNICLTATIQKS